MARRTVQVLVAVACLVSGVMGAGGTAHAVTAPTITVQPVSTTVDLGQAATFTVAATGDPTPTAQWWRLIGSTWTGISGATGMSYTFTPVAADDGAQFRVTVANSGGSRTSSTVTLNVRYAPIVNGSASTAQVALSPGSTTGAVNLTTSYVGNPTPTVAWEVSTDGGTTFTSVPGATADTYTPTLSAADDWIQYRPVVTNSLGSTIGPVTTVRVGERPTITLQPTAQSVAKGSIATFTSQATSPTPMTVRWLSAPTSTYTPIPGATAPTLSFPADVTKNVRVEYSNDYATVTSTTAALTVLTSIGGTGTAPYVTSNLPSGTTVMLGDPVSFTIEYGGDPAPSVQWQRQDNGTGSWANITGATGSTYAFTATKADHSDNFRAMLTNAAGSTASRGAGLSVRWAPTFSGAGGVAVIGLSTPTSTTSVSIGRTLSGSPTPTMVWQRSTDGGSTWTDVGTASGTGTSFTVSMSLTVGLADSGTTYRMVATNTYGTTISPTTTLDVGVKPMITAQPTAQTAAPDATATFSSAATSDAPVTVQWQQSANNSTFTNIAGATSPDLSFTAANEQNNFWYRAVYTNAYGTATTNSAKLTVLGAPVFKVQPPATLTLDVDQRGSIPISVSGGPNPTVQWQTSADGGATWADMPGVTNVSSIQVIGAIADHLRRYRAVATNSQGTTTSNEVVEYVRHLQVTSAPVGVTVDEGQPATFSVVAGGYPDVTYQWRRATLFASYVDIPGATSSSYTVPVTTADDDATSYQVVVTNGITSITTDPAPLKVRYAPRVLTQPTTVAVAPGSEATFTATASGDPIPTTAWERSDDGGITWVPADGSVTDSTLFVWRTTKLTVTAGPTNIGSRYRAVFSNSSGSTASEAAVLDSPSAPTVTLQPADTTGAVGQSVSFTAAATGTPAPTVAWQRSTDGGATWTDVGTPPSTTLTVALSKVTQSGQRYRAVFTNAGGSVPTASATLTVIRGSNTITFQPIPAGVRVGDTVTLLATSSAGLTVSFTGSPGCPVSGGKLKPTAVGTCTVTAVRAGTADWEPAAPVTQSVVVAIGSQTVKLAALPTSLGVGDSFTPVASATSGLPVTIEASGACSLTGTLVQAVSGGTCSVTASQPGNVAWLPASPVTRTVVVKQVQTITFPPVVGAQVGVSTLLGATATSGGTITYVGSDGCPVSGGRVRPTAVGTCHITAFRPASTGWFAATPVTVDFEVARGTQTVKLSALPTPLYVSSRFTPVASATSGLAVTVAATGACTMDGNEVVVTSLGTCTVTVTQPGDANWWAAAPLSRSRVISP